MTEEGEGMDFAYLQQLARRAGYRIDAHPLIAATTRYPRQVSDLVVAASQCAAADLDRRLLTGAAARLRDLMAGAAPDQLYLYAHELSEVCTALADTGDGAEEVRIQFSDCCAALQSLDPDAVVDHNPDHDQPPAPAPPPPDTPTLPRRHPCPRMRPRHHHHRGDH